MTTRSRFLLAIVSATLMLLASATRAAPCAGFVDVDDASPFCANVTWIKTRGITLGCSTSLFCPDEPVSRLAMAAFLNRLEPMLPPVVVDANGRVFGTLHGSEGQAGVWYRHADKVHLLRLHWALGLPVIAETTLYFELPSCNPGGKMYVPQGQLSANYTGARSAVVKGPNQARLLVTSTIFSLLPDPNLTSLSERSTTGVCTEAVSSFAGWEVAVAEDLTPRLVYPFLVR